MELPTHIKDMLIAELKLNLTEWNQVIEVANSEDAKICERQLCAKVLWERAESTKMQVQKQCNIYHDLYLNLAHKEAQQVDKNKMHGMLTDAIKGLDTEEIKKLMTVIKVKTGER